MCYAMLCSAYTCYAMLCYAMICHAMLCYAMHGYVMAIESWASTRILYLLCMCYAMLLLQEHNLT